MTFPIDLFVSLDAQVAQLLVKHGYEQTNSEQSGPFDSHLTEYQNPTSVVALVWDGKESWLSLRRGAKSSTGATNELFFERFPALTVPRPTYQSAAAKLLATLEEHLASGP